MERAIAEVLEGAGAPDATELDRHVRFIEMPPVEVSSSQVRERIARGEPVAELVGEDVARYIEEHGLYEPPGAVRA